MPSPLSAWQWSTAGPLARQGSPRTRGWGARPGCLPCPPGTLRGTPEPRSALCPSLRPHPLPSAPSPGDTRGVPARCPPVRALLPPALLGGRGGPGPGRAALIKGRVGGRGGGGSAPSSARCGRAAAASHPCPGSAGGAGAGGGSGSAGPRPAGGR